MGWQDHLGAELTGAFDGRVEVIHLEPQEHAVAVRAGVGVADGAVVVLYVPSVQLEHELLMGDQPLVLRSPVRALAVEQPLVPATAGLDVPDGDERLRSHGADATTGPQRDAPLRRAGWPDPSGSRPAGLARSRQAAPCGWCWSSSGEHVTFGFHMANRPAGLCFHSHACRE